MARSILSEIFRVIDLETTGLDPATDAIVEIGWALMKGDGELVSSGGTLINPGRPIPRSATLVHYITDEDVAGAPMLEEAIERYPSLVAPSLLAVAHNARFDGEFIQRAPLPLRSGNPYFLCTLRLAQSYLPGLPGYSLTSLSTAFQLGGILEGPGAHRAENDAAITCRLLQFLIRRHFDLGFPDDVQSLLYFSAIQRMPFGRYKGVPLADIPADYARWLLTRNIDFEMRAALETIIGPAINLPVPKDAKLK